RKQFEAYLGVLEGAKKAAIDPALGLILVHWPLPHPPGIYNRHKSDFELNAESSYLDNLELADRALGELRAAMEDAGVWENTIILVTSDHMWRADMWRPTYMWTAEDEQALPSVADHRVPFLLKLAGQKHEVEYDPEFNTILTHDLLLALLGGEIARPDTVMSWLDRHR
ncbi:MAG: sulfatase-like hydrolase/transferase, partial [Blastocatellia bacterium]